MLSCYRSTRMPWSYEYFSDGSKKIHQNFTFRKMLLASIILPYTNKDLKTNIHWPSKSWKSLKKCSFALIRPHSNNFVTFRKWRFFNYRRWLRTVILCLSLQYHFCSQKCMWQQRHDMIQIDVWIRLQVFNV